MPLTPLFEFTNPQLQASSEHKVNKMTREDNIRSLVTELKTRQNVFAQKSGVKDYIKLIEGVTSARKAVRLKAGESKTITLPKIKLGRIKFEAKGPTWAAWECEISYMDFTGSRPSRKFFTLRDDKVGYYVTRTVDRGSTKPFNPFSLSDWKRQFPSQLVLDTCTAKFTFHKLGANHTIGGPGSEVQIDDLPYHRVLFSVSARSV